MQNWLGKRLRHNRQKSFTKVYKVWHRARNVEHLKANSKYSTNIRFLMWNSIRILNVYGNRLQMIETQIIKKDRSLNIYFNLENRDLSRFNK